jgi:hypothetical protein
MQQHGGADSITSSARARSDGGISMPCALAVLRLMTSHECHRADSAALPQSSTETFPVTFLVRQCGSKLHARQAQTTCNSGTASTPSCAALALHCIRDTPHEFNTERPHEALGMKCPAQP